MIAVSSPAISAVGYDPVTHCLKVRFTQGRTYEFCRVPPGIFEEMLSAPCKSTYYDRHIKNQYDCSCRVHPPGQPL